METEIVHEMLETDTVLKTLTTVGIQTFVLAALDNLVADGKVTARIPGKMPYYMAVPLVTESHRTENHERDPPH